MKSALILCSGGLDSVVTAHYVKKNLRYRDLTILFFDYGQRALVQERKMAMACAKDLAAKFKEIKLKELGELSGSLINRPGKTRRLSRGDLKDTGKEDKLWYMPCRNIVFLSYALALAESHFLQKDRVIDIFVGFKNEGRGGFPDTTKEFVRKMNSLGEQACAKGFKITAPLIEKDKEDIVLLGEKLKVDLSKTFSCYIGGKKHCGRCLACMLRKEGFYWAGVKDVTAYAS